MPFLTDYTGWALFIDCDFIFKQDVADLFALADDKYAVMCAHHDYTPKEGEKPPLVTSPINLLLASYIRVPSLAGALPLGRKPSKFL